MLPNIVSRATSGGTSARLHAVLAHRLISILHQTRTTTATSNTSTTVSVSSLYSQSIRLFPALLHGSNQSLATDLLSSVIWDETTLKELCSELITASKAHSQSSPKPSAVATGTMGGTTPVTVTAAGYVALLHSKLHDIIAGENAIVLFHLLEAYKTRSMDAQLQEEIIEAVKLICGEAMINEVLPSINAAYQQQPQPPQPQASASKAPPPAAATSRPSRYPTKAIQSVASDLAILVQSLAAVYAPFIADGDELVRSRALVRHQTAAITTSTGKAKSGGASAGVEGVDHLFIDPTGSPLAASGGGGGSSGCEWCLVPFKGGRFLPSTSNKSQKLKVRVTAYYLQFILLCDALGCFFSEKDTGSSSGSSTLARSVMEVYTTVSSEIWLDPTVRGVMNWIWDSIFSSSSSTSSSGSGHTPFDLSCPNSKLWSSTPLWPFFKSLWGVAANDGFGDEQLSRCILSFMRGGAQHQQSTSMIDYRRWIWREMAQMISSLATIPVSRYPFVVAAAAAAAGGGGGGAAAPTSSGSGGSGGGVSESDQDSKSSSASYSLVLSQLSQAGYLQPGPHGETDRELLGGYITAVTNSEVGITPTKAPVLFMIAAYHIMIHLFGPPLPPPPPPSLLQSSTTTKATAKTSEPKPVSTAAASRWKQLVAAVGPETRDAMLQLYYSIAAGAAAATTIAGGRSN